MPQIVCSKIIKKNQNKDLVNSNLDILESPMSWTSYYFGKSEENTDLSRIYLAVHTQVMFCQILEECFQSNRMVKTRPKISRSSNCQGKL